MNNYRLFLFLLFFVSLTGCAGKNIFVVSEMETSITSYRGKTSDFRVNYCVNNCEKKFNSEKLITIRKTKSLFFSLRIENLAKINYQIWVKYKIHQKDKVKLITRKIYFSNKKKQKKIATYKIYAPENILGAIINFQILIKSGDVLLFPLPTTNYVVKPQTKGEDFAYGE